MSARAVQTERGDGTTSRQIKQAPQGAIFVWCNDHTEYARDLAAHLGRADLKIWPLTGFELRLRGYDKPVVVDHAATLNARQRPALRVHESRAGA